jgi:NADH-quinone oxidoreductase subunit L
MIQTLLFSLILIPLTAGIALFVLSKKSQGICVFLTIVLNFFIAVFLFGKEAVFTLSWAGWGMDFSLRIYHFSGFIILIAAFFSFLVIMYSLNFFKDKHNSKQFFVYLLISLALVNGATLANNLVVLLFFWEGLLLTLFALIAIGGKQSFKTATKAFVIVGISDLCLMAGIALTGHLAKTLTISQINLSTGGINSLAFILLVIGAISKAGAMPFHSWIPDAAEDAPLPFMAVFPAVLEKLLGIYFLVRICLNLFKLNPNSWLSALLMISGATTIILAVMMALIQKNYKKLLSYHAVSQVGYMILGIGTAIPIGIVGGLFHLINNALYKSCLFFTAGCVEKQTGTTDMEKLSGLIKKMPLTFIIFAIAAVSISGIPPFNGFFSKELIFHAAKERGIIFYIAAIIGAFFTAASFLKLGHTVFLGKLRPEHNAITEAPAIMLVPMGILSLICLIFGVFNYLLLDNFIQPILGERLHGQSFSGFSVEPFLITITLLILIAAIIHHLTAVKLEGSALKAAQHIYHAPVLTIIYYWAEKKYFDPYVVGLKLINKIADWFWRIDRQINRLYDFFIVTIVCFCSQSIRKIHSGYYVVYIYWALLGAILVILYCI